MATTGRQITYVGPDGLETIELVEANLFGNGDLASRPVSGTAVGDIYIVLDTALDQYRWDIWDGTAWQTIEDRKSNLSASAAPAASNDSTEGYEVGSLWIDTTADVAYIAVDVSTGAAVWSTLSSVSALPDLSDVAASVGSAVQGDLFYRNATEWVRLSPGTARQVLVTGGAGADPSWSGPKLYPTSATDPVSPAPADGDRYYNTTLDMEMRYDAGRSKWLSVEAHTFQFGRSGNTATGSFYRLINGMTMTTTRGEVAHFNGTVTSFAYSRSDSDNATFEVLAAGTQIYTLNSTATTDQDTSADADFSQGDVLSVRNLTGLNTTSNVQGWVRVRWRV